MEITNGEIITIIIAISIILYYVFRVYKENQTKKVMCGEEEMKNEE